MFPKLWPREFAETSGWIASINVKVSKDRGAEAWIRLGVRADYVLSSELGRTVADRRNLGEHIWTAHVVAAK